MVDRRVDWPRDSFVGIDDSHCMVIGAVGLLVVVCELEDDIDLEDVITLDMAERS